MKRFLPPNRMFVALMAVVLFATQAYAQVAGYSYSQSAGTFTPITGGTVFGSSTTDDQRFIDIAVPLGGITTTGVGLPIGFNFVYNGITFDRLAINANGWISLGQSALTPSVNMASTSSYTPLASTSTTTPTLLRNRIAALGRDLEGQTGSEIRLETIGTSPNQICVIQWTGYRRYFETGENLNFQIRLYETSNIVEVVFGTMVFNTTVTSHTGTSAPHVGLGGTIPTDFNNRFTTTDWNATTAGTANNVGCAVTTGVVYPVSGTTFRWAPPSCFSPATTSVSNYLPNGITYNWSLPLQGTPTAYEWRLVPAGNNPNTGVIQQGSVAHPTNNVTITGLTPATSYSLYVRSICTPGDTANFTAATTFITPCTPFTVPWTEDFEAIINANNELNPPTCWDRSLITGNQWRSYTTPIRNNIGARSGTDYMYAQWSSNAWLYTPGIQLNAGTSYEFKFWYVNTDVTNPGLSISVAYGTNPTAAAMTTPLGTLNNTTNTTYDLFTVQVNPTVSGVYYFGLNNNTPTATPWYFLVDDFSVTELAGCTTTPVAGTASGPSNGVTDSIYTFTLSGYTGSEFLWQVGPTATGPFSNIGNSNNDTLFASANAAGTYFIRAVVNVPGCTADTSNVISITMIKPGDNVCDAINLNLGINGPYNTVGATVQTGEPAPPATGCETLNSWCLSSLSSSLWFKFAAPASGRVRIQTPGFDTQIALWASPDCNSILTGGATLVAANDDNPSYLTSGGVEFSSLLDSVICLTPGQIYYLQLDPYSGAGGVTTVVLTDLGPGPDASFLDLNDGYCAGTPVINLNPVTAGGTFFGAGVVNGNQFDADVAASQVGFGNDFVIYHTFWACYESTDTLRVNALPTAALDSVQDALCNGQASGNAFVSVSGAAPLSYAWSNGASSQNLTAVQAGSYGFTVTDNNFCTASLSAIEIGEPTELEGALDSFVQVSCFGLSDGAIYISVSGGTTPYTYLWSNGSTDSDLVGVSAGSYTGTVTDANGCTLESPQLNITQPDEIVIIIDSITNNTCAGSSTGEILTDIQNGQSPLTFAWSNGAATQNIASLVADTYTLTVTDAGNCSATASAVVVDATTFTATVADVENVNCNGNATGSVDIELNGGTSTYYFEWSNNATSEDLANVGAGTYSVTVTDVLGCTATATATVTEPAALSSTVSSVTNVACFGGSTGALDATVTGGTSPYTYAWSNSQTTQDITSLTAGNYVLTTTDANGCSSTVSASVTQPTAALSATTSVTDQTQGGTAGSINLNVAGGTSPYSFAWSNSATTQNISNLPAGVYSATITDANGCTLVVTDTVNLIIGIEGVNSSPVQVAIYPNPAQDVFFVQMSLATALDAVVEVYNINGQLITRATENNVVNTRISVDLSTEAAGVYYVKVMAGTYSATQRLVLGR